MVQGRNKGSRFERKVAKVFGDWCGIELMRTPQSGGMSESFPGDIMPKDKLTPFPLMIECKHQEGWTMMGLVTEWPDYKCVMKWWKQCVAASIDYEHPTIPLLVFKKNRTPMFAMIRWKDVVGMPLPPPVILLTGDIVVMLLDNFLETFDYAYFRESIEAKANL